MCPVPQGAWAKDSIPISIHFSIWKGELAENTFTEVLSSCVVRTQEQFLSVITDLKRRQTVTPNPSSQHSTALLPAPQEDQGLDNGDSRRWGVPWEAWVWGGRVE